MRVAVVYHVPNPGGVTRFTHALIDGLLEVDPSVTVDYYVSATLMAGHRIGTFPEGRVNVIGISDPDVTSSNLDLPPVTGDGVPLWKVPIHAASTVLKHWPSVHERVQDSYGMLLRGVRAAQGIREGKSWQEFKIQPDVLQRLETYDVVYLPFPFYLEPVDINAPLVATFHDVNHLYFPANFGRKVTRLLDRQLEFWTSRVDLPVESTEFIKCDVERHYKGARGRSEVIFVAPYSVRRVSEDDQHSALNKFGLSNRSYLFYPSNNSHHKNIVALLRAADHMKRDVGHLQYPIVLSGFGTDGLGSDEWESLREANDFLASSSLVLGEDVKALGFVSDVEVDSLTRNARIVVSTSLYEAGCGPALDAWQFGVPVAFSDIPPFIEQLDRFGVHAAVFDPSDPSDIASVISEVLGDYDKATTLARESQERIGVYTWRQAAAEYEAAFRKAIDCYNSGS